MGSADIEFQGADIDFTRALTIICWVVENPAEEDTEEYRERAEALIARGLDLVK